MRDDGELILNQNINRDVNLDSGNLVLGDGVAFDGDVFARDFSTVGGTGTFRGNIDFANGGTLSGGNFEGTIGCLLYTSPSPRDQRGSRMPSSA